MVAARAYMVERYWPGVSAGEFQAATDRVRASVGALAGRGLEITFLHSTFVPTDEAAQWVIRAATAELVADACAAAGLAYHRLLPAVDSGPMR